MSDDKDPERPDDEEESQNDESSEDSPSEAQDGEYGASSIQVLEGLEAVRKRPAMYIGDTSRAGLHHLIWEVVDNSVDEALAKRCDHITVTIHKDESVSVTDNGAGIPVDMHPKLGVPALEVILTKLHAGGKFDDKSYQVSGGLHGVGVSVVNALSEWVEAEVHRDGKVWRQTFERGHKSSELAALGDSKKHGTTIRFKADAEIFETTEIVYEIVHKRMRELAYLMGTLGLHITLIDERTDSRDELEFPAGLVDFVEHLKKGKTALHEDVIYLEREHVEVGDDGKTVKHGVEVALQYNDGYNENIFSFVNNINTHEGGTHLSGFKTALTRTFNHFAKKNNIVKDKDKPPSGDDLREGLIAIISVKVPDPQFESQTKIRLGNREVEGIVNTIVGEGLRDFLEENPKVGKGIFEKALQASRAREAARKARDSIRRKSAMENSTLPLKLVDCHRGTDREKAELFLVEGDSAGGTAVSGRASFQAVLPLRGKILNVEKAPIHKVMDHREIEAIVTAIGTGFVGEELDPTKLRYNKIIIMTDADVDGSHIRTLLLTFFYRKMPELVKLGHVYVAQPPLYMLHKGKKYEYVHSDAEKDAALLRFGLDSLGMRYTNGDGAEREFSGDNLQRAITTVRSLLSETAFSVGRDGFGISDLVREHDDKNAWPTHRIALRSERVRATRDADALFVTGGETELDEIIKATRNDIPDLVVAFDGEGRDDADVIVESIHLSKRFKDLIDEARGLELPLLLVDRHEDYADLAEGSDVRRPFALKFGSKSKDAATLAEAVGLFAERDDVDVTRFKGLGEMDADQLWESAMDPERRVLYQVGYADEVETDNLFTILMGSVVEPRREFIEKHSLEVQNLDV